MRTIKTLSFLLILLSAFSVLVGQSNKAPKVINGGVVNGKATSLPKPLYPDDARKAKLGGSVKVQVVIDEAGNVIEATAVAGLENVSLRIAAEQAAMNAKFSPTRLSGVPVKVQGVIVYNFVVEPSNEERLEIMGMAAALTFAKALVPDYKTFKEAFDGDDIFDDTLDDLPRFKKDLEPLRSLERLSPEKRVETLSSSLAAIRTQCNDEEKWQFDVGTNLGEVFGEFVKLMPVTGENPDFNKFDEEGFKINLKKISDLLLSAPTDFPPSVLTKLRMVTAMSDRKNLKDEANLKEIFEKIESLFETISPGSTK